MKNAESNIEALLERLEVLRGVAELKKEKSFVYFLRYIDYINKMLYAGIDAACNSCDMNALHKASTEKRVYNNLVGMLQNVDNEIKLCNDRLEKINISGSKSGKRR